LTCLTLDTYKLFPQPLDRGRSVVPEAQLIRGVEWLQETLPKDLLAIPRLTLRNIVACGDIFCVWRFRGFKAPASSGRIKLLVFENFSYRPKHERRALTLSPPKALDHEWEAFGGLVERADEYRVIQTEGWSVGPHLQPYPEV